jgi:hypothetical protein
MTANTDQLTYLSGLPAFGFLSDYEKCRIQANALFDFDAFRENGILGKLDAAERTWSPEIPTTRLCESLALRTYLCHEAVGIS